MMLSPDETEDIEPASNKKKPETALGEDEDTTGKEKETERFLREPTLGSETLSLEWWRKNAECLTTFACMARKVLCIPAIQRKGYFLLLELSSTSRGAAYYQIMHTCWYF